MTNEMALPDNPAEAINREYHAMMEAQHTHEANQLERGYRTCSLLCAKKKELAHGEFTSWVEANCDFSPRWGRIFMEVYNRWPEIEAAGKTEPGSVSAGIKRTLRELADPSQHVEYRMA